ncbi:MAG: hypothetical protein AUI10_07490 [Actinobacteria bacterium 13_2_20CM_2_72_6]|nr:MAG: hypothetical protein AUI10_07490 [Actinobacteria bacterium 13_2_20CM_2_72_6]
MPCTTSSSRRRPRRWRNRANSHASDHTTVSRPAVTVLSRTASSTGCSASNQAAACFPFAGATGVTSGGQSASATGLGSNRSSPSRRVAA